MYKFLFTNFHIFVTSYITFTIIVGMSVCLSLPSVSQYMMGGGRKLLESAFQRLVSSRSGGSKKAAGGGRRQKDKAAAGANKKVSTLYLQQILPFLVTATCDGCV